MNPELWVRSRCHLVGMFVKYTRLFVISALRIHNFWGQAPKMGQNCCEIENEKIANNSKTVPYREKVLLTTHGKSGPGIQKTHFLFTIATVNTETRHVTQKVRKLCNISGMRQRTQVFNTPNSAERHRGLPYIGHPIVKNNRKKRGTGAR